jgi:hypothetical protein
VVPKTVRTFLINKSTPNGVYIVYFRKKWKASGILAAASVCLEVIPLVEIACVIEPLGAKTLTP